MMLRSPQMIKKIAFDHPRELGNHRLVISNIDGSKMQEYSLECEGSPTYIRNLVWVSDLKMRALFESYHEDCSLTIEDVPLKRGDGYYNIGIDNLNTIMNAESIR